jgi:hypothetical protein
MVMLLPFRNHLIWQDFAGFSINVRRGDIWQGRKHWLFNIHLKRTLVHSHNFIAG